MATSSFFTQITIDDKAADIIIKGLNSPKAPRPPRTDALERGRELLKQFSSNLEKSSTNPQN